MKAQRYLEVVLKWLTEKLQATYSVYCFSLCLLMCHALLLHFHVERILYLCFSLLLKYAGLVSHLVLLLTVSVIEYCSVISKWTLLRPESGILWSSRALLLYFVHCMSRT